MIAELPRDELARMVRDLEAEMKQAAKMLEFEQAATLRDQLIALRKIMEGDPADVLARVVALDGQRRQGQPAAPAPAAPAAKAGGKPGRGRGRARYS